MVGRRAGDRAAPADRVPRGRRGRGGGPRGPRGGAGPRPGGTPPRAGGPAPPLPGGASGPALSDVGSRVIAFHGPRQAGIATPPRPQARAWLAGFDLAPTAGHAELVALLRRWTVAAAALTAGSALGGSDDAVVAGSG